MNKTLDCSRGKKKNHRTRKLRITWEMLISEVVEQFTLLVLVNMKLFGKPCRKPKEQPYQTWYS